MCSRIFYCILVLLVCLVNIDCTPNTAVCARCTDRQENSTMVEMCKQGNQTGDLRVNHSCCVNSSLSGKKSIVGLDLSSCNLKTVTGVLNYLHNLQVLMLEDNSELKISLNDFKGLSNVQYLSLPPTISCPGGNESWNSTEAGPNKMVCRDEINLCDTMNVTCPNKNSHCILMAPGEMECLCNAGYHGYKCLRQGMFSYSVYLIVLCVCTVVISGFLWCTQRRHVKNVHSD